LAYGWLAVDEIEDETTPQALAMLNKISLLLLTPLMFKMCVPILGQLSPQGGQPSPVRYTLNPKKSSQSPANETSSESERSAMLNVMCNMDCTLSIDSGWKQPLFAGRRRSFTLKPGRHSIYAHGASGQSRWQSTVVLQKGLQTNLVIPLDTKEYDDVEATERKEILSEIEGLQTNIETNRKKLAGVVDKRNKLLDDRGGREERLTQLRRKAEAIVNQIQSYEAQVGQEFALAELAETEAQQDYNIAIYAAGQNNTLAKITAIAAMAAYTAKKLSAEKHTNRAKQLIREMDSLSHQLYLLSRSAQ
jgi:hypothetical protein